MRTNRRELFGAGVALMSGACASIPAAAADRSAAPGPAGIGADRPWTTYLAQDMRTNGAVLGPKYDPHLVETESSRQKCVKLTSSRDYLELVVKTSANAMVVRY